MTISRVATSIACSLMLMLASPAPASDHFLTIGGGYSPTGNQVSLEKNVILFEQLLAETYAQPVPHDIFFADGKHPGRDLQFIDPAHKVPAINRLLATVFQQTRYLNYQYRSNQLEHLSGPSRRTTIDRWFNTTGRDLQAGDRLILYVTAHGGKARDKKTPMNTSLYLWNNERIQMSDLVKMLDQLDPHVQVVTIMVQCYSGGFANLVFQGGDDKQALSPSNRCGFFATVHDRMAAGCTPDVNEDNYREYSSYFWEALRGQTRQGEKIDRPDYNQDGIVSFAEAHAYCLLKSPTIDLSVKTSDTFLRKHSRATGSRPGTPPASTPKSQNTSTPTPADTSENTPNPSLPGRRQAPEAEQPWLTLDSDFDELLKHASIPDRQVLIGLSNELHLTEASRAKEVRQLATQIQRDKKKIDIDYRKQTAEYKQAAGSIVRRLQLQWPEMSNRWHPQVQEIMSKEAHAVTAVIQKHSRFRRFETLGRERQALTTRKFNHDRQWIKCQRLLRTMENVALATNLPLVAAPDIVTRFRELTTAENGTLGPHSTESSPQTARPAANE
ncbi:MAG: hypothetical protein ABGZ17_26245 [Planctomycetaceae bacterium]